jgi:hypothetical protein
MYRKEYNRANQAHAEYNHRFYDGWAIFRKNEDDGTEDLVAVADTETLADTLIAALDANNSGLPVMAAINQVLKDRESDVSLDDINGIGRQQIYEIYLGPAIDMIERELRIFKNLHGDLQLVNESPWAGSLPAKPAAAPAALNEMDNPSPGKIQIVVENEGGSEEPVLVTFNRAKAKAKYLEIIKAAGRKIDLMLVPLREDDDGIERAEMDGEECVRVDGEWHNIIDGYGDKIVRWFETDVEGPTDEVPAWDNNLKQFPRLLAEINAAGAVKAQAEKAIAESMDLHPAEIRELFDRAEVEWMHIKQQMPYKECRRVTPEDELAAYRTIPATSDSFMECYDEQTND